MGALDHGAYRRDGRRRVYEAVNSVRFRVTDLPDLHT
jgi:hypothetical protein